MRLLATVLFALLFLPSAHATYYCNNEVQVTAMQNLNTSLSGQHSEGSMSVSVEYDPDGNPSLCGSISIQALQVPNELTELDGHTALNVHSKYYIDGVLDYATYSTVWGPMEFYPMYSANYLETGLHNYTMEYYGQMIGGHEGHIEFNTTRKWTINYLPPTPTIVVNMPEEDDSLGEVFDIQATVTEATYGVNRVTAQVKETTDDCFVNPLEPQYEGYPLSNPSGETWIRSWNMLTNMDDSFELTNGEQYLLCVYAESVGGGISQENLTFTYIGGMKVSGWVQDFDTHIGIQGVYVTIDSTEGGNVTPYAYWPMDEGSGNDIYDSVGSNDGTKSGASWVTGYTGNALEFDGDNDYVAINSMVASTSSDTTGTIAFWFKQKDHDGDDFIFQWGDTDAYEYLGMSLESGTGKIEVRSQVAGATKWRVKSVGTPTSDKAWHHIALVKNASDVGVFVDGEQIPITYTTSTDLTVWLSDYSGLDNFNFGRRDFLNSKSYYLNGTLDDFRYYQNLALTPTQVAQLNLSTEIDYSDFTWTTSQGYYEFTDMGVGVYEIEFQKSDPDYITQSYLASLPPSSIGTTTYLVASDGSGGTICCSGNESITVRLVEPDGSLIDAGANNCNIGIETTGYANYTSGSWHQFIGLNPSYNYTIQGACDGYTIADPYYNVSVGSTVTMVLATGEYHLVDLLVTNQNGNIYPGSLVVFSSPQATRQCTTDNYGQCSFVMSPGEYTVTVTSGNHYEYTEGVNVNQNYLGNDMLKFRVTAVVPVDSLPELTDEELKSQFRQQIYQLFTLAVLVAFITLIKFMGK